MVHGVRLIPARAGTTTTPPTPPRPAWAHPRAGGDHVLAHAVAAVLTGSSPRGRGPPHDRAPGVGRRRLIPARAGTTSSKPEPTDDDRGSSPRGRGPREPVAGHLGPDGLIPARAGTTETKWTTSSGQTAHPRAGGDHDLLSGGGKTFKGSSPRGRGPLRLPGAHRGSGGLIPARAGTTCGSPRRPAVRRAHPRAGGDHSGYTFHQLRHRGSSPRGRGPLGLTGRIPGNLGLIPARAGTTPSPTPSTRSRRAHPRAGGDHWVPVTTVQQALGSSPRGRGPRERRELVFEAGGLIPARAGTTTSAR